MPFPQANAIPLSLYVHIPWCVRKCPYCDFNSHASPAQIPEREYVAAVVEDLQQDAQKFRTQPLTSLFFGGGTPSLFSADAIEAIITAAQNLIGFASNIEITLEANPGTAEYTDFRALRCAGVNRLSLGVQSFNSTHLQTLGRIHSNQEAISAFHKARAAGFNNINLDLMHGLPNQTTQEAIEDLSTATQLNPEHLSWYQLTIEPNTVFYNQPPALPNDDALSDIQDEGESWLFAHGYKQYEVSAYARQQAYAQHNMNYWQFGDYLGIGAGAHGKITQPNGAIIRYRKTRLPADYLNPKKQKTAAQSTLEPERLPLEFMLNALRLPNGVPCALIGQRTRLSVNTITPIINSLVNQGLLQDNPLQLATTPLGFRFLNTVLNAFWLISKGFTRTMRLTSKP